MIFAPSGVSNGQLACVGMLSIGGFLVTCLQERRDSAGNEEVSFEISQQTVVMRQDGVVKLAGHV